MSEKSNKKLPIGEDSYRPFLVRLGFLVGFTTLEAFEGICAHNKSAELLLFIVSQPVMGEESAVL